MSADCRFDRPVPIAELRLRSMSRFDSHCEAHNNQFKISALNWSCFGIVTSNGHEGALKKFHQNDLRNWYRLAGRTSAFLGTNVLGPRYSMRSLGSKIPVRLLTLSFSHRDIVNIAGGWSPMVTEHLGRMERDRILILQGRRMIASTDKLELAGLVETYGRARAEKDRPRDNSLINGESNWTQKTLVHQTIRH
jgi:hypothetical protein